MCHFAPKGFFLLVLFLFGLGFFSKWMLSRYWHVWFQQMISSEKHAVFTQEIFLQRRTEDWKKASSHCLCTLTTSSSISAKPMSVWWTAMLQICMVLPRNYKFLNMEASHTSSNQPPRRSEKTAQFQAEHSRLMSPIQCLTNVTMWHQGFR